MERLLLVALLILSAGASIGNVTCPADCACKGPLSVDCRGSSVSDVTGFLFERPIAKL